MPKMFTSFAKLINRGRRKKMNHQLYITWADEILAVATHLLGAGVVDSQMALNSAHDLVSAHVANLEQARQSQPE